jgi:hypothetical protein
MQELRLAGSGRRLGSNMKTIPSLAVLTALIVLGQGTACYAAAEDGVALAIVYDTSGSMADSVPDQAGHPAAKYTIANRALIAVAKQLQAFATNSAGSAPRKMNLGLFVFQGDGVREAIKFGAFDASAVENWARGFKNPSGNTPLGNALTTAGQAVLASPLSRKHVLFITDGMNTVGPKPEATLPTLQQNAERKGTRVSVHFIAFDVAGKVFDPVKKLGATVVSASDEKQLNSQLDFILQSKILLEEEEPKK